MIRRRKTSPAEVMSEIISLMPWWVGVAIAVVSHFLLHRLALESVTGSAQPSRAGSMAVQTLWQTLANFGQYLVPLICLAGAGVSAWRQRGRRQLVTRIDDARSADVLDDMGWQQFEILVGEGFRLQGYSVAEIGGGGADGGVDLVLTKGSEKFLVQCKQWRAVKVGVAIVRELYGVMAARGAAGGFVVTSGRFTEDAAAFAKGRNVQLIDGPRLLALLRSSRGTSSTLATPLAPSAAPSAAGPETCTGPSVPNCPLCTGPMVIRTARRGANIGAQFWGCSGYPSCRGTRATD